MHSTKEAGQIALHANALLQQYAFDVPNYRTKFLQPFDTFRFKRLVGFAKRGLFSAMPTGLRYTNSTSVSAAVEPADLTR